MRPSRRFGREGYAIALIARDQARLDAMVENLAGDGFTAKGFAADVLDPEALTGALEAATAELGAITALQYSPLPFRSFLTPVLETEPEVYMEALRFSVMGLIHATRAVIPGMQAAGGGAIVLVNGGTSVKSRPDFAGTSVAFPAESAYGEMLHDHLAPQGIRVSQLVIPGAIPKLQLPGGIDDVAQRVWELATIDGEYRTMLIPLEDGRE